MGHNSLDLASVARLADVELMDELHGLVQQDRALTARLLLHLGEVEARGLYRDRAFSSMFDYAVEALHMSPNEAYVRLRAAKLAREFPLILQMLERNELHLTAMKLLAPHLTQTNHVHVLERARSRSKREVEILVAELAPKPDVPSVVRRLPGTRAAEPVVPQFAVESAPAQLPMRASAPAVQELRREAPVQLTTPLSPGRYKVQFTATQALHDKLQQLKDLMRHQVPDGDLCALFERAADLLIEQQMKRRFAEAKRPRSAPPDAGAKASSRYVPRATVREVHARDAGRCTFVSPEGRRCTARGHLELHHEDPYARGGPPTVGNLKLMCRSHNALLAEKDFGRAYIQRRRSQARSGSARNEANGDPLDPCSTSSPGSGPAGVKPGQCDSSPQASPAPVRPHRLDFEAAAAGGKASRARTPTHARTAR